jgi:hypothetical protein
MIVAPRRERTWQGADDPPSRVPTRYGIEIESSRASHPYAMAFDALVDALWTDDGAAAGDIVSGGVIGADDVFVYGPAVPYQTALPGVLYMDAAGGRLSSGGRLPVGLARPTPPTPLGQAVAMGAVNVVDALIRSGARPWPTAEALLDVALATLPAAAIAPDAASPFGARPVDGVSTALRLIDAFAPSIALDPWDHNPLTVLRMALTVQHDDAAAAALGDDVDPVLRTGSGRARRQGQALLGRLLDRYSPDALAAPVAVSDAPITIAELWAPMPLRFAPDHDAWRVRRASQTERDALAIDLRTVGQPPGFSVQRSPPRLVGLLEDLARAYDDNDRQRERRQRARRGSCGGEDDENDLGDGDYDAGGTNAERRQRPSPWLSVASMVPANIDALLTSRQRPGANAAEMARDTAARLRMMYAANGCADYVGCASLLIEAIARDNHREVRRLTTITRGLTANALIDGHRLRTAGNPSVVARWMAAPDIWASVPRGVADAGGDLVGGVFTTPLAVAVSTGAIQVVHSLIDDGARPWPTVEALLAPALSRPLAERIDVAAVDATGIGGSRDYLARVFDAETAQVTRRPYDPLAVVRSLTEAFPRRGALSPWDLNPLTVARAHAIHQVARIKSTKAQRQVAMRRLIALLSALIDAGYSPQEPTAGIMVRAPCTPSSAPTEIDAAVHSAARAPLGTLAHALATAAVGLYAARQAWAEERDRPSIVAARPFKLDDGDIDSTAWVLVGDQPAWQIDDDNDDDDGGDDDNSIDNDNDDNDRDDSDAGIWGSDDGARLWREQNTHDRGGNGFRGMALLRRDEQLNASGSLVRSDPVAGAL